MYINPQEFYSSFKPDIIAKGKIILNNAGVKINETDRYGISAVIGEKKQYNIFIGNEAQPFSTEKILFSKCDCSKKKKCQHAAAVIMHYLKSGNQTEQSLDVLDWLEDLAPKSEIATNKKAAPVKKSLAPFQLLYILTIHKQNLYVTLKLARPLKSGGFGTDKDFDTENKTHQKNLKFDDERIAFNLSWEESDDYGTGKKNKYQLTSVKSEELLKQIVNTNRCFYKTRNTKSIMLGDKKEVLPQWEMNEFGEQYLSVKAKEKVEIFKVHQLWYLSVIEEEIVIGETQSDIPIDIFRKIISAPPIPLNTIDTVKNSIQMLSPHIPKPKLSTDIIEKAVDAKPCLRLSKKIIEMIDDDGDSEYGFKRHRYGYYNRPVKKSRGIGEVYFNYAGIKVRAQEARSILYQSQDGQLTKIFRDFEFEFSKLVEFKKISSLETIEDIPFIEGYDSAIMHDFYIGDDDDAFAFSSLIIPMLKDLGWSITAEDGYIIEIIQDDAVEWYSDIEESEYDWFGLNLGVVVDGEKINILPLIVSYLKTIDIKKVKELPKDTKIPIQMSDGRTLMMPSQRLQGILNVLTELYDSNPLNENGELILSNLSASQLLNLEETIDVDNFSWLGSKKIKDLGKRLKEFTSVQEVIPPESFKATLRSYQQQGVNWLRFLNDFELGGILADDMGLGKTIQTLACLVIEQTKNPEKVSLIISPTSLVANWALEAAKFAPSLKVLVLHGSKRKQHFDSFNEYDVIITSYPLILRDEKVMLNQSFNYLVLDEAQFIKNASAKATKVIYKLKAKHRLCLSGTPIENHLGELWSQFRFLAPGLLGTAEKFRRLYQHPIEKSGNELRRNSLASRIKPFMLRRTKSEVAIDLPPKTEIIKTTSLEGPQLDLYESIRLAMDKKVREAISSQGLQRSHIIVLDALLKLRQTCCDPRLLKIESAKKAHAHSAKLKLLMDLVPNMIEEGRRILLFSQFSSMIKLIQDEFNKNNIEYVTLSGSTKDRRKPIESFQNKEVPVFLISLKAGGIGLNLTAADTIIHYDPWWNPAVENQATDRAHRIGQDKPVFVYKLITEGTVEEKILEMQNHKKSIVEGLLSENSNVKAPLRQEDLEELFKPLDGLEISA